MRLICTGDILPADRLNTIGIGAASMFNKHAGEAWMSLFVDNDFAENVLFGNLESPLTAIYDINGEQFIPFAGDIRFASWLSKVGYDFVSVANNHILEQGIKGFRQTIDALTSNNIQAVGFCDAQTGSNLVLIEKKGIRIGFAAFNAIHDIRVPGTYAELEEASIYKAIKGLKNKGAHITCLSFHWGNEYIHIPSWQQIQLSHNAIDAGADIIIGHHPHVIQPVEKYKNGYIIYSLGNFIFDMLWAKNVRTGMCVYFEINEKGVLSHSCSTVEIQKDCTPRIISKSTWLENTLKDNQALMGYLHSKGEKAYTSYYEKKRTINRVYARIGMKKQLAGQWFSLPVLTRKMIIKEYIKRINKV